MVLDDLERRIDKLDVAAETRALLVQHLAVGRRQAADRGLAGADLPLLVHAAVTGDETPALSLGSACVAVYLGADLFDDVADGDVAPEWLGEHPSIQTLAAATLLASVPQLIVADLPVAPDVRARLARELGETLLNMAAGQHADLSHKGGALDLAAAREAVERKSGAEFAGFAACGAILAGAPDAVVDAYRRFGANLGAGGQIASDLAELWDPDRHTDLANGTATLAITHALDRLSGDSADQLRTLLACARAGEDTSTAVRELLWAAGSVQFTALAVQLYCVRARRALADAGTTGPSAEGLRALIDASSLLPSAR